MLTDVRLVIEPVGVAFAAANALLFAAYIVLGHRVATSAEVKGLDGLALSMLIAAFLAAPIGAWQGAAAFADPITVAAAIGVGISSSVIPYVCDQLAMARLPRATYALLVSLLPATATVLGVLSCSRRSIPPESYALHLTQQVLGVRNGWDAGGRPVPDTDLR